VQVDHSNEPHDQSENSSALSAQSARIDQEGADKIRSRRMDMRQFAGSSFITIETLRDGPRAEKIVSVEPGRYDQPVVTFESGDKFSLNKTNVNTLIKAYGPNAQDWIDCTELYVGDVKYNGGIQESVLVRPSPPKPVEARTPVPKQDMDDGIPFCLLQNNGPGASCSAHIARSAFQTRIANDDRRFTLHPEDRRAARVGGPHPTRHRTERGEGR
jgi:hypothetical protein